MMKNASKQARALAQARERRRELDRTRDEQDARIEEATASALVGLESRAAAEQVLASADVEVAEAVRALFAEGVGVERAAALLEVDVTEVRRLAKVGGSAAGRTPAPAPSGGHAVEVVHRAS